MDWLHVRSYYSHNLIFFQSSSIPFPSLQLENFIIGVKKYDACIIKYQLNFIFSDNIYVWKVHIFLLWIQKLLIYEEKFVFSVADENREKKHTSWYVSRTNFAVMDQSPCLNSISKVCENIDMPRLVRCSRYLSIVTLFIRSVGSISLVLRKSCVHKTNNKNCWNAISQLKKSVQFQIIPLYQSFFSSFFL